jgi:hypothetical protein
VCGAGGGIVECPRCGGRGKVATQAGGAGVVLLVGLARCKMCSGQVRRRGGSQGCALRLLRFQSPALSERAPGSLIAALLAAVQGRIACVMCAGFESTRLPPPQPFRPAGSSSEEEDWCCDGGAQGDASS